MSDLYLTLYTDFHWNPSKHHWTNRASVLNQSIKIRKRPFSAKSPGMYRTKFIAFDITLPALIWSWVIRFNDVCVFFQVKFSTWNSNIKCSCWMMIIQPALLSTQQVQYVCAHMKFDLCLKIILEKKHERKTYANSAEALNFIWSERWTFAFAAVDLALKLSEFVYAMHSCYSHIQSAYYINRKVDARAFNMLTKLIRQQQHPKWMNASIQNNVVLLAAAVSLQLHSKHFENKDHWIAINASFKLFKSCNQPLHLCGSQVFDDIKQLFLVNWKGARSNEVRHLIVTDWLQFNEHFVWNKTLSFANYPTKIPITC